MVLVLVIDNRNKKQGKVLIEWIFQIRKEKQ